MKFKNLTTPPSLPPQHAIDHLITDSAASLKLAQNLAELSRRKRFVARCGLSGAELL
jgi:hypothetical protein